MTTSHLPIHDVQLFTDTECRSPILQQMSVDLPQIGDIQRILIIKWGGMGDVVISTAIMEDIYQAFPKAELHLNAMPPWDSLFTSDARFSKVWHVDLRKHKRNWWAYLHWCRQVVRHRYDLVIDLQTNDKSRLLLSLLRLTGQAPRYLLGNHPVYPYNVRQKHSLTTSHSLDIMHQTLATGGIQAKTERPILHVPPADEQAAMQLMYQHRLMDHPFAILLCGSHASGLTKRWGAAHYATLAHKLQQQGMQRIVLVGGEDDVEECETIATACPGLVINLCGKTALLGLPTLFTHAQLIVGNDTGTAHLASTTTTPMLVICGPTDPRRVKPVGPQVQAIQADLPCKNCYQKTCHHHSCMLALSVNQVASFLPLHDLKQS